MSEISGAGGTAQTVVNDGDYGMTTVEEGAQQETAGEVYFTTTAQAAVEDDLAVHDEQARHAAMKARHAERVAVDGCDPGVVDCDDLPGPACDPEYGMTCEPADIDQQREAMTEQLQRETRDRRLAARVAGFEACIDAGEELARLACKKGIMPDGHVVQMSDETKGECREAWRLGLPGGEQQRSTSSGWELGVDIKGIGISTGRDYGTERGVTTDPVHGYERVCAEELRQPLKERP